MYRYTIKGVVQGVGFRPYVANACKKAHISGYVQNVGHGVIAVVDDAVKLDRILNDAPSRIRIDSIEIETTREHWSGFRILPSKGVGYAEIPPDLYLCEECLCDLDDADNRRWGYHFLTCTACGPRFTIARKSPFDRATTTMDAFPMCPACRREYGDPKDRRFHAQTIACHDCGPKLRLFAHGVETGSSDEKRIESAAAALASGEVVALKGVGGFHLACRIDSKSVGALNTLTRRTGKPYAVLCRDTAMAKTIARITTEEEELLVSASRPIVLLRKNRKLGSVSELDTVGVMLASTALHFLLFRHYPKPIVFTSSNLSDEPITTTRQRQFADIVLDHSRVIVNATDDSVMKVIDGTPLFLRRSRGFVPSSIPIDSGYRKTILAVGAEMNATFALYDGNGRITISQHLGNTSHAASFDRYRETIDRFLEYTGIAPQNIVCDLHPGYNTSVYAKELSKRFDAPLRAVQHHRAHVFGAAAENGLECFAGIACDGLGYGDDGTIWGGEIFDGYDRIGHLETQMLLGGDSAARYPLKMLYSIIRKFLTQRDAEMYLRGKYSSWEIPILERQLASGLNSPMTSSCGRILDATAALLGFCDERTYDGRGAMVLESRSGKPYEFRPVFEGSTLLTTPLFEYLISNLHRDKARLAGTVQRYLAEGLFELASRTKKPVVWAGGCAYNRIMTSFMLTHGVLLNKRVPPGDGGISFGQICAFLADPRNDVS